MDGITIDLLRNLCKDEAIFMTQHVYNRCRERGIRYADIKSAILNGEIIEQYPNDYPYPSCLTFGTAINDILYACRVRRWNGATVDCHCLLPKS